MSTPSGALPEQLNEARFDGGAVVVVVVGGGGGGIVVGGAVVGGAVAGVVGGAVVDGAGALVVVVTDVPLLRFTVSVGVFLLLAPAIPAITIMSTTAAIAHVHHFL
jgi:hypothetical protein